MKRPPSAARVPHPGELCEKRLEPPVVRRRSEEARLPGVSRTRAARSDKRARTRSRSPGTSASPLAACAGAPRGAGTDLVTRQSAAPARSAAPGAPGRAGISRNPLRRAMPRRSRCGSRAKALYRPRSRIRPASPGEPRRRRRSGVRRVVEDPGADHHIERPAWSPASGGPFPRTAPLPLEALAASPPAPGTPWQVRADHHRSAVARKRLSCPVPHPSSSTAAPGGIASSRAGRTRFADRARAG
jgi:hypothetical protein